MSGLHIAGNRSDAYTPTNLFGGEADIITNSYVVAAGITLAANAVLAINGSNELVEWVPAAGDSTAVAIGISCEAIDTTGGAAEQPVYIGGAFNTDAIQWPAGATDAQKLNAFINTNITHRKLGYSG